MTISPSGLTEIDEGVKKEQEVIVYTVMKKLIMR